MISNRIKIFLIPFVTVLIMLSSTLLMLLFGYRNIEEIIGVFTHRMLWALANAILTVTVFYFTVGWFNKKMEWSKNWSLRLLLDALLIIVYSVVGILAFKYMFDRHHFNHDTKGPTKEFIYIMPLVMDTLFLVLIELFMGMEERNKLALQVAHLEKEQINTKYGALKNQLDHHFLFNNLSVLSSIIYEDVDKADKFIQRFSKVYRYVLSINKRDLVSLEEEINFIKSYLDLYKFRFENGFNYDIKIEDDKQATLIAPLTLQVLVENAIKHNVVSYAQPLQINIFNKENCLLVKNNLQLRDSSDIESTKTGQSNIIEKYKLLNQTAPVFNNTGESYIVKITLIPHSND